MSRIKKYTYTANGGERFIQNSNLIGRNVLRVRRDGISRKIRKTVLMPTLSDMEVYLTSLSGGLAATSRIFFLSTSQQANKLQPGEKIEILYV